MKTWVDLLSDALTFFLACCLGCLGMAGLKVMSLGSKSLYNSMADLNEKNDGEIYTVVLLVVATLNRGHPL